MDKRWYAVLCLVICMFLVGCSTIDADASSFEVIFYDTDLKELRRETSIKKPKISSYVNESITIYQEKEDSTLYTYGGGYLEVIKTSGED